MNISFKHLAVPLLAALLLAGCGGTSVPADDAAQDSHVEEGMPGGREEALESTRISRAEADANGIKVAKAGAGRIAIELEAQGVLMPIDGSSAQVTARYPGTVRALRADVGDRVESGRPLASVLSNLSLTTYPLSAPIPGVVTARRVQVGGGVAEGQVLYEIADLSRVWADLHVFGADVDSIRPGAAVTVERMYDDAQASSRIERILPGAATASQSTVARATLDNVDGLWRPGMAIIARIAVSTHEAALVVPRSALQTMEGRDVVFVRSGETYTARPVRLGRHDAWNVAVVEGVQAGEEVVVGQSYLVKADIEKSGAAHEH